MINVGIPMINVMNAIGPAIVLDSGKPPKTAIVKIAKLTTQIMNHSVININFKSFILQI